MTDVRKLLAKNIKRGRDLLGISQMQLAERAGCSASYLGDIETGKKFPAATMFGKIAEALNFRPYQLLLEDEDELNRAANMVLIKQELESKLSEAVHEANLRYQALVKPNDR